MAVVHCFNDRGLQRFYEFKIGVTTIQLFVKHIHVLTYQYNYIVYV